MVYHFISGDVRKIHIGQTHLQEAAYIFICLWNLATTRQRQDFSRSQDSF
jgi:hypothetical protein